LRLETQGRKKNNTRTVFFRGYHKKQNPRGRFLNRKNVTPKQTPPHRALKPRVGQFKKLRKNHRKNSENSEGFRARHPNSVVLISRGPHPPA